MYSLSVFLVTFFPKAKSLLSLFHSVFLLSHDRPCSASYSVITLLFPFYYYMKEIKIVLFTSVYVMALF